MGELGQIARDYRELGSRVVADRLDAAVLAGGRSRRSADRLPRIG